MNRLPLEIVHKILEYDGKIKYRNGKYMNQISLDDERYSILQNMPIIIPNRCYGWNITMITSKNVIYMDKHIVWYSMYVDKDVVWYSGKEDQVIITIDDAKCYYSFVYTDFCYKWTICKLP